MHARRPLIDIYPVGVLACLLGLGRALRARHRDAIYAAYSNCRREVRYVVRSVRARNWRVAKNSFNGYLAEHRFRGTRCGHGWTRRRALRDLRRHLAGRD
ncbi:hypothetical protein [Micromonospora sp. NPDC047730]|uniref:hypothetical protein n=1 Tax=Micromonospora sp. NPDC047730 TaxID=3364253 RepID=UPI003712914F